jgi:hypothetical protein
MPLAPSGKSPLGPRPVHARIRGTLRDRHETLGVECDGRAGAARRAMPARTAKSCGPDASTLASTRDNALHCAGTGARKPDPRGEHEGNRKTIAQGMPDDGVVPVVTNSCAFFTCTRGCGCTSRPAFPAPSLLRGRDWSNNPDVVRAAGMLICVRCLTG